MKPSHEKSYNVLLSLPPIGISIKQSKVVVNVGLHLHKQAQQMIDVSVTTGVVMFLSIENKCNNTTMQWTAASLDYAEANSYNVKYAYISENT